MVTYTRTATPARKKKPMLIRLDDDMIKKVNAFRLENDLETDQSVGIALIKYAIEAFERGDFVLPERSTLSKW